MKKLMVISLVMCLGLGIGSAQVTTIDGTDFPLIFDTSGDYQFTWTDTLFVNYERAATAADSAKIDSCGHADIKSIYQFNANNITIDGNGKVIYSAAAGKSPDIQPIWPNKDYAANLDNFYLHDFTVMNCNIAVYLTRVSNVLVENVTVKEAVRGIYPNSKQDPLSVGDTVRSCTFENIANEAIPIRGAGHQILNNTISATRSVSTGIMPARSNTEGTADCLIKGNVINGNGFIGRGIRCDASGSNTFENNTINEVTQYGVGLNGHSSRGRADENTFLTTAINLSGADSALGISFDDANNNLFDGLTIDSAGVAIKAFDGAMGNVITNATITNSTGYDVHVLENSKLWFLDSTDIDATKLLVEPGSAIFFGEGFTVSLDVTTPWEVPVGPWDVSVYNGLGHLVGTYGADGGGIASFKLAESGVSSDADTTIMGGQNPYTVIVETGDLYRSYNREFTAELTADTAITIDMAVRYDLAALPAMLVTSEEYTLPMDTLKLNYMFAADAADSAEVTETLTRLAPDTPTGRSIIQLNADKMTFDGNGGVIYGPNLIEKPDQYNVQGIWPNRIYTDTTELVDITVRDVTVIGTNNAIYATEVRNGLIEDCEVRTAARGIYVHGKNNMDAAGSIIRNNTVTGAYKEAIVVRGGNVQVLNNIVNAEIGQKNSSSSTGISLNRSALEYTTDVLVEGNTINCGSIIRRGIRAYASGGNTYRGNVINAALDQGLYIDGHSSRGRSDENAFIMTSIFLAGADSAIGIFFDDANFNLVDSVVVDSAGVVVKSVDASRGNTISNAIITNRDADGYDVVAAGGSSVYFTEAGVIDAAKCMIEDGSAVFIGSPLVVDLEVVLENSLPLAGMDVIVTNAAGDEVGQFTTDEAGMVYIDVGTSGVSASGSQTDMNPFTFSVVDTLDEGFSSLLGSVTETVTANTSITMNVDYLALEAAKAGLPKEFALAQNYPNPFNPSTNIPYALPVNARVAMRVYDVTGRLIQTLVSGEQTAGYHRVVWDGTDNAGRPVASGIYLFELTANDFRQVNKMMLLK